jgi:hypothetical protein
MVFTGVTAFIIAIFYSVVSCVEGLQRTFWGIIEVVINAIWVIFWMAGAGSFAAYAGCKPDMQLINECDKLYASQAFAWLSWLLWVGSLIISVVDWRRGEGITGKDLEAWNYPAVDCLSPCSRPSTH